MDDLVSYYEQGRGEEAGGVFEGGGVMKTVILAGLIVFTLSAKDHNLNWQTGRVVDEDKNSRYVGQTGGPTEACPNCVSVPHNIVTQTVAIAGDDYTYVANRGLNCVWGPFGCPKPADLIVNSPVKFAVEKRKNKATAVGGTLFIVDENGKQYALSIVKQIQGGRQ